MLLGQGVGLVVALAALLITGEAVPPAIALGWAAVAGAAGAIGLALFYLALSRGTMGLVAPLTALLAAAIPATVGLLGGDPLTPVIGLGMLAAMAAVVLIAMPDRRLGTPVLPTYHGSRAREWLLIVASGLAFAAFFVSIDASHDAGGDTWWPMVMVKVAGVSVVGVGFLGLAALGRQPAMRPGRAAFVLGSLTGLCDLGGNVAFLLATAKGTLSVAVVISSLYPVGTALLARSFLHERLSRVRVAGVGLAVLGVVLIGLGAS